MTKPGPILLVSFPTYWKGAVEAHCDICGTRVFEHAINLTIVRQSDGYVICPRCALAVKQKVPEVTLKAQLFDGRVRRPEPASPMGEAFVELMNEVAPKQLQQRGEAHPDYPIIHESDYLSMWVVFDHPADFPNSFVARRRLVMPGNDLPMSETIEADTLEELQGKLPPGLVRLERHPDDNPKIIEVWC